MNFFEEFSGFLDEKQEREREERRLQALNARLQSRICNYSNEETLENLCKTLTFVGGVYDVVGGARGQRDFA